MATYKIIVAKYNENIDWIKYLKPDNVIIYDKSNSPIEGSIPRRNVGREAETFMYYILENYDNLADYTIFLQGNPFDHMKNINPDTFQTRIEELVNHNPATLPLFTETHLESPNEYIGLEIKKYYKFIFGEDVGSKLGFSAGAQYIVPKRSILYHSKSFYERLHSMLLNSKISHSTECHLFLNFPFDEYSMGAWTFERLMFSIFQEKPVKFTPIQLIKNRIWERRQ
jgi:hypothetical protein